jgi:hypothetical protein
MIVLVLLINIKKAELVISIGCKRAWQIYFKGFSYLAAAG